MRLGLADPGERLSFPYIWTARSIWHSYAASGTSISEKSLVRPELLPKVGSISRRVMKLRGHANRTFSEFSALMSVVDLLAAATFAKSGVATQILHLGH